MSIPELNPKKSPAGFGRRQDRDWALLLIALTVVAYLPAILCGYIWDDDAYVTSNTLLTDPRALWRIWFSLDSPSQYFPLTYTVFWIERAFWGLNPAGYHAVNILIHVANALLLWWLLSDLKVPGAWLGAAIFAVHPVHVESVAWISELKNVLMFFFYLLSLLCWIRVLDPTTKRSRLFYLLSLGAYGLALASKTTACTLPAALLLILWLRREKIDRRRLLQVAPFFLLGAAMGLVTMWWERYHQGTRGTEFAIGVLERALIAGRGVWFYLGKLLWPVDLTFSYPRWFPDQTDPRAYGWLLAALALGLGIWFVRRFVGRSIEVAGLFFVVTLSPVLGFIMLYTFRYAFVADHYQYVASVGPIALGASAMILAFRSSAKRTRRLGVAAGGVLLAILAVLSWRQCLDYWDSETLYRATIERNPASWMAYNNLGDVYLQKGDAARALSYCQKAEEIKPDDAAVQNTLGKAYRQNGKLEQAVFHYRKALELKPDLAEACNNLGNAFLAQRKRDEAISYYFKAIELRPAYAEAHNNLGQALLQVGREEEGIGHCEKALALQPESTVFQSNVAFLLATCPKDSVRNGGRAVTLAERVNHKSGGKHPLLLGILAAAYAESGKFPAAIATAEKALTLVDRTANPELARTIEGQLKLYRAEKPFRTSEP